MCAHYLIQIIYSYTNYVSPSSPLVVLCVLVGEGLWSVMGTLLTNSIGINYKEDLGKGKGHADIWFWILGRVFLHGANWGEEGKNSQIELCNVLFLPMSHQLLPYIPLLNNAFQGGWWIASSLWKCPLLPSNAAFCTCSSYIWKVPCCLFTFPLRCYSGAKRTYLTLKFCALLLALCEQFPL